MPFNTTQTNTPTPRHYAGVNWMGVRTLIRRQVVGEILIFRLAIFGPAFQALLFASVIWIAVGNTIPMIGTLPFLEFLAPGLVIAAAAQRAFESTAFSLVHEKLEGTISDTWGAPLSPFEILTGYVIGSGIVALMIGTPVWLILIPFGVGLPTHPLIVIYFFLSGCVIFSIAGLIAGMIAPKWDALSAVETFLIAPLLFLSGSFFSIQSLKEPFQSIMALNPIFHLVNGFRYGAAGEEDAPLWISAVTLGSLAALALVIGYVLIARGYKIRL